MLAMRCLDALLAVERVEAVELAVVGWSAVGAYVEAVELAVVVDS